MPFDFDMDWSQCDVEDPFALDEDDFNMGTKVLGMSRKTPMMDLDVLPLDDSVSQQNCALEKALCQEQRILDLTKRTNYSLIQRNGQRIYGGPPPNWEGPPPEKGCEVFVGKLPRDCFEPDIVPIFERVGTIYELRLMMDFSGSNRGYCFVRFSSRMEAKRAVAELNDYEIRPNKKLGVVLSVDNRKLWISGIPKDRTKEEIKEALMELTDGVENVILYPSAQDKSKTRGYAFVEYESHRSAALARRKLVPGRIFLLDTEIDKVDWAEPEPEVDEETMKQVRILFVRNLPQTATEEDLRSLFEYLRSDDAEGDGQVHVERVKKNKDYAFVHFRTRQNAEVVMEKVSNGFVFQGSPIEVTWSKPVDKHSYNARKQITKLLSQGAPATLPIMHQGFEPNFGPMYPMNGGSMMRGILPRKRGAAGIKGLGPPGTVPPRNLIKLTQSLQSRMNLCTLPPSQSNPTFAHSVDYHHHHHGLFGGGSPSPAGGFVSPHFPICYAGGFMPPTSAMIPGQVGDVMTMPPTQNMLQAAHGLAGLSLNGGGGGTGSTNSNASSINGQSRF